MFHFVRNKFFLPASWVRVFIVTLVFVILAAGLFWLDFFRSYRAEVTLLVVSRPGVSQDTPEIAANLAGLTQTLSFYDRLLKDNDLIDDAFEGYAPDKRKALWNDAVSVKEMEGESIIRIQAKGNTPEMAVALSQATAQTLFSVASFYYNVKTDIDLRIIDGPIISYGLVSPFWFAGTSICTGFFVTVLFFLLLNAVPGFIGKRKGAISLDEILARADVSKEKYVRSDASYPAYALGETVPWIDPKKFIPAKPSKLSFENITQGTAKKVSAAGQRAPAPANLPVAPNEMDIPAPDDAVFPFEFEGSSEVIGIPFPQGQRDPDPSHSKESLISGETAAQMGPKSEPTLDEYKRRLNNLLSGDK